MLCSRSLVICDILMLQRFISETGTCQDQQALTVVVAAVAAAVVPVAVPASAESLGLALPVAKD